jgi:hypothetical protein
MIRRFVLLCAVLAGVVLPASASAPLVGTVTFECPQAKRQGLVWGCTFTWESDASGDVSGNAKLLPYGYIIRFDTDPDADAPTDNYDITLLDSAGVDLLQGQGADRDTANNESVIFSAPIFHDSTRGADLTIANAGASNNGVVTVWVRRQ